MQTIRRRVLVFLVEVSLRIFSWSLTFAKNFSSETASPLFQISFINFQSKALISSNFFTVSSSPMYCYPGFHIIESIRKRGRFVFSESFLANVDFPEALTPTIKALINPLHKWLPKGVAFFLTDISRTIADSLVR